MLKRDDRPGYGYLEMRDGLNEEGKLEKLREGVENSMSYGWNVKSAKEGIGTGVWQRGQCYLEEKSPMAVDSLADHTNGNNIRLKLKLELTEVQHPWEFMHLFHLHCSTHGITHQPDIPNPGIKNINMQESSKCRKCFGFAS